MRTLNHIFYYISLLAMLQQVCSGYQIDNTRDYNVYIGSHPLTALTQFSMPKPGPEQSSNRVSVPTVMCGAHVLAPDLLLTSIRCYPWPRDSVDVYVFPRQIPSSELNWRVKEARVIHDDSLVNVTFFLDYPMSPGHLVSNAALVLLNAPYLASTNFTDLDIGMNDEDER